MTYLVVYRINPEHTGNVELTFPNATALTSEIVEDMRIMIRRGGKLKKGAVVIILNIIHLAESGSQPSTLNSQPSPK